MPTPPPDPGATRRERVLLAVLGAGFGALVPLAVSALAALALASGALLCLGIAAFGSDRLISRLAQVFTGWP